MVYQVAPTGAAGTRIAIYGPNSAPDNKVGQQMGLRGRREQVVAVGRGGTVSGMPRPPSLLVAEDEDGNFAVKVSAEAPFRARIPCPLRQDPHKVAA